MCNKPNQIPLVNEIKDSLGQAEPTKNRPEYSLRTYTAVITDTPVL
eukprot:XP_001706497.1 Hypothetical protein GL50803_37552 [Giardia lamblia ATCC 50803]